MTVFTLFKSIVDLYKLTEDTEDDGIIETKRIFSLMGVFCMTVMFIEMNIYRAYKKDIMFSIMTLIDFVGMYVYNNTWYICYH